MEYVGKIFNNVLYLISFKNDVVKDLFFKICLLQTRRVRFDLPPPDGSDSEISNNNVQYSSNGGSSNNAGGVGNVEHVNSWIRSRRSNVAPAITSVTVVSSTTPVRQRAHTVGKYVRGTLSPTAATNTGGGATPALLKAARDTDDVLLKDILRRSVLVGIPEKELNAQDSSGRVSKLFYTHINIYTAEITGNF